MTTEPTVEDRLADLDETARRELDRLDEHLAEVDDLLSWLREELPEDEGGTVGQLRELVEAIDEFEDVVRKADPETIAASIDTEEIDADDIRAMLDSEEDLGVKDLLEILDLEGLWHATDVRDLWKEIQEFQDEAEDVGLGADDEDGDDGDGDDDGIPGIDMGDAELDDIPDGMADELSEKQLQSTVMDGVDEFRETLIAARSELKELQEENRKRMSDHKDEVHSRNPTAVSTMPSARPSHYPAGQYSTVPQETRYSSAPNKRRLYGRRLDEVAEEAEEAEDA
ncbi:hypothetical protein HUG10_13860 [Halorarum halophilum]|uniref:Uncharacterized protein n=1 Tax=Halorarum halophilum TaxID=2743090 RepID=A0A7D5GMC9_9EURY|nr:hypothetical protein [Halobaculum halophilum]QLG28564.1 hypothetical protein HUG10_13860 [Halobaculum halophilum]